MALSAVQNVSFKGNECKNCQKKTGGAVPLIASLSVPGLGQYIDGRGKAGKKFFLGHIGASAAAGLGAGLTLLSVRREILTGCSTALSKAGKIGGAAVTLAAVVAGTVNHIKNLKDAYQGNKNINIEA